MKEYLNQNTLFITVKMYVQESSQLLLVVEGDDDHLVLKEHCTANLRLIAGVGGRENVLRAAALARAQEVRRVRFLIDRDYDDYKCLPDAYGDNVYVSKGHDIFMDLYANDSHLFRRVIDVHTARTVRRPKHGKIAAAPVPDSTIIAEKSLALATHLAAVRIVDARRNLNLDFKRFSFGALTVGDFNIRAIAREMIVRRGYEFDDPERIIDECVAVREEIDGKQAASVGDHDLFSALARVLRQFRISVSDETLQDSFIMGISCSSIRSDGWFMDVQSWCAEHSRTGFDCDADFDVAV